MHAVKVSNCDRTTPVLPQKSVKMSVYPHESGKCQPCAMWSSAKTYCLPIKLRNLNLGSELDKFEVIILSLIVVKTSTNLRWAYNRSVVRIPWDRDESCALVCRGNDGDAASPSSGIYRFCWFGFYPWKTILELFTLTSPGGIGGMVIPLNHNSLGPPNSWFTIDFTTNTIPFLNNGRRWTIFDFQ